MATRTRAPARDPTESADLPAAGTWTVRVTDNVTGNTGTLQDVQLAVHLAGGRRSRWRGRPRTPRWSATWATA
ncbi:MAG: proprotein convertase P-domain-containing protein [Kofleriaceae bacterium]|nr:proprotein convertase P-domain-containing protein [Kofleriaceae bacterium]